MTHPGTVIVTGGSRGIGAATVRLAAAAGYDVCFTYREQDAAAHDQVREIQALGRQAMCVKADAGGDTAAEHVFELAGALPQPVTALVNNAGITGPIGPFSATTAATMRRVLDVNVMGTMLFSQQAVRRWLEEGRAGSIVNISSIAATLGAPGEYVHYAASKAAVEGFTVGLAREVAAQGIRVNAVSPGTALTDIHATAGEPDRPRRIAAKVPMGRVAHAEEIAEAVVWLLSDKARYVTGAVLRAAGGL
ncbi:oxidoreductase [Pigmentiphaga sp. NML080357]|uniref:SDR family oxidoreductase n=1 Tax=Pigmentiphaga sp. NML080357 TaxID=2008675 RepID=UPI000B407100|nr:SDR family oxidoreductase [Pigmentiphaga sp. NML080357]OVZ64866.1 oxidoreductase [Pigmentiphaga sp. NML080357]